MMKWLDGNPEEAPPPATVLRGRKVQFMWDSAYLRIDDRFFCLPRSLALLKLNWRRNA